MSTPSEPIQVRGLVKRFGRTRALNGLDLRVRAGQVHGFLGPNGAGKSTTIRVLLGLIRAGGGEVRVLGQDPWRDAAAVHSRLAYVPGDVALWPALTGGQCLDALASIQGGYDARRRGELIERFRLDPGVRVREYSKGNRQKVALVAAFAARADLLILDEPTSGLDPLMENVFQDCVRERRAEGATVLLSSHILAEVEALADRVSIVRQGSTVLTSSLGELRRHARTAVHALTELPPPGLADLAASTRRGGRDDRAGQGTQAGQGARGGVTDLDQQLSDGLTETRLSTDADHLDEVVARLHQGRIRLLTVTPPTLDTLFRQKYEEAS